MFDFLEVAPWMVVTAVVTWLGNMFAYRKGWRKMELQHMATVEASRDDLAIELLSSARAEIVTARAEMVGLREELKALRVMEQHFHHFQQALDHLAAVLNAKTDRQRATAERNARAFLDRMALLREARNLIADEEEIDQEEHPGSHREG